ncbi:MAG: DUF6106 family protein [Clostridia bacterium]|nr:DUF6106 family protein [Clostridia bacterium]
MMDNFREEVVVRRKSGLYSFVYVLCWITIVFSAVLALIGLQNLLGIITSGSFDIGSLIITLAFGAVAFFLWRNKDTLKTEYEYTFTNGDLDVSKVLNNQKRKYLTSVNMKDIEAAGEVTSPSFQRYITMPEVKRHNWFLNRESKLYFYYFTKNGTKHIIVLELSDEMAELTRKPNYMGMGVWQK